MMKNAELTFNKIISNNSSIHKQDVKRILVLNEEKVLFLGDFCIRFDKLRYCREFFSNATLQLNYTHREDTKFYDGLLRNNPHLNGISSLSWEEIPFENYDLIFIAAYKESMLADFLDTKYGEQIRNDQLRLCVFSMSKVLLSPDDNASYIFPVQEDFGKYIDLIVFRPGELYLSKEEREWGDRWLEEQGMRPHEQLLIVLDSTARRAKLLNIHVYFEFLTQLLARPATRVLIFDERSIGKQDFYREWLRGKGVEKIIFSKSLSLREDLCLLGSSYTKMVFGPCTGLMHCASGIYNNYVANGMREEDTPVLITYTGQYPRETSANIWWGAAPLMNCLMLREKNHKKEIVLLHDLTEEEKKSKVQFPCSDYTVPMLIDFVGSRLKKFELTPLINAHAIQKN